MPLTKKAPEVNESVGATVPPGEIGVASVDVGTTNSPTRIGGERKAGDKATAPMTKDDYWRRREERDIETGIRIRRSGVWQAALQSVGVLQFNAAGDLEGLLKIVEEAASKGLEFINKNQ